MCEPLARGLFLRASRADETVKNDEFTVENGKLANDDVAERTEEKIRREAGALHTVPK